jgi:two-component system OmpR family response regulator
MLRDIQDSELGHLMIVDDDPQIRRLFALLLERAGYAVAAFGSGAEALRWLDTDEPVDLVVLDLDMPTITGFDLLRALRYHRRSELRVLVVSGCMEGALLKPAQLLGAAAGLSKLDAPRRLVAMVCELLKSRTAWRIGSRRVRHLGRRPGDNRAS